MIQEDDRIYFTPGLLVRIKQDLANKPIMLVVGKVSNVFKHSSDLKNNVLKGIKCIWFNTKQELQEGIFNTKDLEYVD